MLLIACASTIAQNVTLDTTYLLQESGTFFLVQDKQFDNGAQEYVKTPIGDSLATVQFLVAGANNRSEETASFAVRYINDHPPTMQANASFAAMYTTLTGLPHAAAMAALYPEKLANYRLFDAGNNLGDFELITAGNGTLRLRNLADPGIIYTVVLRSNSWLQVNGLNAGQNVNIYLTRRNAQNRALYQSTDRRYRLTQISG